MTLRSARAAPPLAPASCQPRCRRLRPTAAAKPLLTPSPPCVLYEDEHLLAVNKPAGLNTHAAAPYAPDGVYDWLRGREPRWEKLAIHSRLDAQTSGVLLFGLSAEANKSLAAQWEARSVEKTYTVRVAARLASSPPRGAAATCTRTPDGWLEVRSGIVRDGERYSVGSGGVEAVTRFRELAGGGEGYVLLQAQPLSGRTHQIRVHAALLGAPVLGDALYGGPPDSRLWLHAASLRLLHPVTGEPLLLEAPPAAVHCVAHALLPALETTLCRVAHGRLAGLRGRAFADALGDVMLVQGEEEELPAGAASRLLGAAPLAGGPRTRAVFYKRLRRDIREAGGGADTSPQLVAGECASPSVEVSENGVRFELRLSEGYSVGLFGDQRENRRRLLTGHVAPGFGPLAFPPRAEVLNTFAYTCGFSVCCALRGARVTSLDLSRKYLAWGAANFERNGLLPAEHDFIYGDAIEWMGRLARKGRRFSAVLLDPPTFSSSPGGGRFSAERDFGALATQALLLLEPGGLLFASTNAARLRPEAFEAQVCGAVTASGRCVLAKHFATQPPDFAGGAEEPAYLKTLWLRVS